MKTKGASDIRGIRSLNTRPGPITESNGLLKLYLLAAEKENLRKKLDWAKQQEAQAEKRLTEIAHAMNSVKRTVEERAKRDAAANAHPVSHHSRIEY